MTTLLIQENTENPNAFELREGTTSIGRHPESTIVLDDGTISARHAEIVTGEGGLLLRDLGSTNGTKVNGSRVRESAIRGGDRICFGSVEFQVVTSGAATEGAAAAAMESVVSAAEAKNFCKRLRSPDGEVIGLWVADHRDPRLHALVEAFQAVEGLPENLFEEFQQGRYRVVRNHYDGNRGAFLVFGSAAAPGEVGWDGPVSPLIPFVSTRPLPIEVPKEFKPGR